MEMMHKNQSKIGVAVFILVGIFSLVYSAVAQEATQNKAATNVPPLEQEATKTNTVTSSEISEPTKASNDLSTTNVSASNVETNTNGTSSGETSTNVVTEPTPADNANSVPLPVDPNAGTATEVPVEETSPVNNTDSIEKKKHEIKVRYNQVRTEVDKEDAVISLRQVADKATTPEAQRQALKAYYELLFKRMRQVDPSLTERCDLMQGAYLRRIEQKSLEPTIPLQKK